MHLQAILSEAEFQLARTETELSRLPFLIKAAEARSLFTRENLDGKQRAVSALPGRVIQQAQSEHQIAAAESEELVARQPRLEHERNTLWKVRHRRCGDEWNACPCSRFGKFRNSMMFRFAPYVFKSLWRHRTRTLLTVSGAAVVLFVFCFVGSVQQGLEQLTEDEDAQRTLIVFQENRFCPTSSRLPQDYADRILKIPGVKEVMPVQVWTNNCRASLDIVVGVVAEWWL